MSGLGSGKVRLVFALGWLVGLGCVRDLEAVAQPDAEGCALAAPRELEGVASLMGVGLAWQNEAADADTVVVQRRDITRAGPWEDLVVDATRPETYRDATAVLDTSYRYRVRAALGPCRSAPSEAVEVLTFPLLPLAPNVSPMATTEIAITWDDTNVHVTTFRLERGQNGVFTALADGLVGPTFSILDSGLDPDTEYAYRVLATNGTGAQVGVPATAKTLAIPQVVNLTATAADEQVLLQWQNPAGAFYGVRLVRAVGSPPGFNGTLVYEGTAQMVTDAALANGTTYIYVAFGLDGAGNHAQGPQVTATPADTVPPGPVTDLVVSPGSGALALSWTNPSEVDFAGVRITRGLLAVPATPQQGAIVFEGGGSSWTDATVTNGITYHYAVFAADEVPNFASGVGVTGVPTSGPGDTTPPAPATSFLAFPRDGEIWLSWVAPSDPDFTGVRIVRNTSGIPTTPTDGTLSYDGTANNLVDAAVVNGTRYYYAAFAHDGVPNYAAGVDDNAVPGVDNTPPGEVIGLDATALADRVQLQWSLPGDPDLGGVRIMRRGDGMAAASPTDPLAVQVYEGTGIATTDTSVTVGTTYSYTAFTFDGETPPNFSMGTTTNATPGSWQSVTVGERHGLALRDDGTLWGWGNNGSGRLGVSMSAIDYGELTAVGSDNDWQQVAASRGANGGFFTLAVKTDGTLWSWGSHNSGVLGNGLTSGQTWAPTQVGVDTDWQSVAAGGLFGAALKTDGTLWTWGNRANGRLGDGMTSGIQSTPRAVGMDTDWDAIFASHDLAYAIKQNGSLYAWGTGVLGFGTPSGTTATPTRVGADSDWSMVAASPDVIALKDDGSLWAWGINNQGELGTHASSLLYAPTRVGTDNDWVAVAATQGSTYAIKVDGTLWAGGRNDLGELGTGGAGASDFPTRVGTGADWVGVWTGIQSTVGLRADGGLRAWGSNRYERLGIARVYETATLVQLSGSQWSVAAAHRHVNAITDDGSGSRALWGWGSGFTSAHGLDILTHIPAPGQVGSDTTWQSISANGPASAGVQSDGSLFTWGGNNLGMLGLGVTQGALSERGVPTLVDLDRDWSTVAVGLQFMVGIRTDGTMWSWGGNAAGELGQGDSGAGTERESPTQIGSDTDWLQVACGDQHTIALKTTGTLWSWGRDHLGQLGLGSIGDQTAPQPVGTDTDWVFVSASGGNSHAIKVGGTAFGWGANNCGTVGDGTSGTDRDTPQWVRFDTDWVHIDSGVRNTVGIRQNGTLHRWGVGNPLLGICSSTVPLPQPVGTDADWVHATSGVDLIVAIKADGTMWSMFQNDEGQLGNGGGFARTPTLMVQP